MGNKVAQGATPISVLGPIKLIAGSKGAQGFTLIEVLVVLLVVGIAMAGIGLATGGFRQRDLEFEADRIAQLFSMAREEAQVRGRPIRMVADEKGYKFEALQDNEWGLIRGDAILRERTWDSLTNIKIVTPDRPNPGRGSDPGNVFREPTRSIQFGREQLDLPFTMSLVRDATTVVISGDGMGRFKVERTTKPLLNESQSTNAETR
jgi:general secretion pathway protein H